MIDGFWAVVLNLLHLPHPFLAKEQIGYTPGGQQLISKYTWSSEIGG
jgi:hypothetical protein